MTFKATSNGIEAGKIIELTDEDLEEIANMFSFFQNRALPVRDKRDLIWRKDSDNAVRGRMS